MFKFVTLRLVLTVAILGMVAFVVCDSDAHIAAKIAVVACSVAAAAAEISSAYVNHLKAKLSNKA